MNIALGGTKLFVSAVALTFFSGSAFAQAYPSKPVKLVVPFSAGGTTDIIARAVSSNMPAILGQSMIVDNKPGAGGVLGANEVAKAKPDGYTLGMATISTVATQPALQPKNPYNPLTDFTPIINVAATPNLILVNPSFPGKDYKSFIAELKNNPNKYSYASSGIGAIDHFQMELFQSVSGTAMGHVPYKGALPALNDVVGGQVPIVFDNLPSSLAFIKGGRLVPIVVAAPQRLSILPDVPTFKEVGLEPVNRMAFFGIYGPKGLPKEVVDRVNSAVKKALEDATVRKRIEDTGSIIIGNTPEQFAEQIKAEYEVYKKVAKERNLKLE